ncbi:META domain-containing protein [Pantoea sp. FN060301]|uniref:META domain-containing protein n=1 Tax=Pantoea sp. FN060301 TaxID=3420380 RepID=UPI003D170ACD
MKKEAALLMAAMAIAGCSANSAQNDEAVKLADRYFVLTSVDGEAIGLPEGVKPGIRFGEGMHVSGVMCNRFFGQGKLERGVLSLPQMASTRMLCSDPRLNEWETMLGKALTQGAKLTLDQQTLTLTGAGHKLVYRAEQ